MDEKDCLILQYLSEEQNFTKAAERLYMTQPALSYRIRQIEKEFQIELFSKSGKHVIMTPAGEYLVSYAKKRLNDLRHTKEHLLNMGLEVRGTLRVGFNNYSGLYSLPTILQRYIEKYPRVHLNVDTGFSKEMMELLIDGQLDVAVVRGDYYWTDQSYLLSEDYFCLISKYKLNDDELPSLPLIKRKEPSVLIKYKIAQDTSLEQGVDFWWSEKYETPPTVMMQVDSYETCKEMVKMGLGYSIIPRDFVKASDNLYCDDLILNNGKKIKRSTWMLFRESSLQLAAVARFVEDIKSYYGLK